MKYDIIINLGACCINRQLLSNNGVYGKTYPFDWLYMENLDQLIHAIDTDLKYFFKKTKVVELYKDIRSYHIQDLIYKFSSVHDVPKTATDNIEEVKNTKEYDNFYNKMQRRKHRWIQTVLKEQYNKIAFVHGAYNSKFSKNLDDLYDILKLKHKKMDFYYFYPDIIDDTVNENVLNRDIIKCNFKLDGLSDVFKNEEIKTLINTNFK